MKKKLKIGLLLDDLKLNELNQEIIHHIIEKNICEKFFIIRQNIPRRTLFFYLKKYSILRIIEKVFIKLIFLLEKLIISKFFETKYFFKKIDIKSLIEEIINVKPVMSESGYFYDFLNKDIEKIKSKNLDVIIRLGSGIIRGELLNASKNGIFSFHHGDNLLFRGGPPGFWEVYFSKPLTGFIIQKLTNVLDGGKIIFKGHVETKSNYYLNQASIFKNSAKYLSKVLEDLRDGKIKYKIEQNDKVKIFKDPKFLVAIKYLFITYLKLSKKFFNEKIINKRIRWHVSYKSEENLEDLKLDNFKVIENNNKNRFLADPFAFKKDNKNFIFLEDFNFSNKKGIISCFEVKNNESKFLGPVLEENFHLSFPYIFEYEGKIFMCPETHQKKEIRIYICEEFPLKWKFYKTLIKKINSVDTILFEKDKLWWLITSTSNISTKDFNELNIFYSENGPLTDTWTAHDLNPIVVNPNIARNGGLIINNDKIFRISQKNGFNVYGESFSVNEIKVLNKSNFKEVKTFDFNPNFKKNLKGTHHLNNSGNFFVNDFCL